MVTVSLHRPQHPDLPPGHCKHCGAALAPNARDEEFCSADHRADFAVRLLNEMTFVRSLAELRRQRSGAD